MRHDMISGYRRTLRSLPGLFLLLSLFLFSCESAWLDETMYKLGPPAIFGLFTQSKYSLTKAHPDN